MAPSLQASKGGGYSIFNLAIFVLSVSFFSTQQQFDNKESFEKWRERVCLAAAAAAPCEILTRIDCVGLEEEGGTTAAKHHISPAFFPSWKAIRTVANSGHRIIPPTRLNSPNFYEAFDRCSTTVSRSGVVSSLGLDILFKRSPHGNSDNLILAAVLREKDT